MRSPTHRTVLVALTTAALLGLTAACAPQPTELNDASVGQVDDSPQFVMTNLDRYPNVAFRCFVGPDAEPGTPPTGIYTTTRDTDNLKLVINDPQCPGYDPDLPTVVTR